MEEPCKLAAERKRGDEELRRDAVHTEVSALHLSLDHLFDSFLVHIGSRLLVDDGCKVTDIL